MALTATATQGFEILRHTGDYEVMYVPGNPGVTYTRGNRVSWTVGEGIIDQAAANEGGLVGTVVETTVCPAATQAFPKPAAFDPVAKSAADLCLVPIHVGVAPGKPIHKVTFANHDDEDVAGYVSSTRIVTTTNAAGGNDYQNGALVYVYEGPGIGEVNVAEDYTNATPSITLHRPTATDLTAASKIIVLAGEAAGSRGVGFFGRCEGAGATSVTVNQGANDGDYVVFMDWRDSADFLKNLTLPVIDARYLMLA